MRAPRPRYFESPVMTAKEVAVFLGVHYSTIYRLIKRQGIPCFRLGSDWRFHKTEVVRWLEKLSADEERRRGKP
jgi:excisionase family DNA binding protein